MQSIPSDGERLLRALVTVVRAAKRNRTGEPTADGGSSYLLHVLDHRGPLRLTELAAASGLDASTASRHARALEEKGLLERSPDPADGRAHQLAISDAGRAHLAELWRRGQELMDGYVASWAPEDVATLTTLLDRLAAEIASPATQSDRPEGMPA